MASLTRVELHCHSRYSDGKLRPEDLADQFAARDVTVASLTDHDTLEGQVAFRRALARRSIGWIAGVELTAFHRDREVHLLAYGFDLEHEELLATLSSVRKMRDQPIASIAEDLRKRDTSSASVSNAAPDGRLSAQAAIGLIHRAGGKVFVAHPLTTEPDPVQLRSLLRELKSAGLDGIEALYGSYTDQDRELLVGVARELDLLVSAGTDVHDPATETSGGGVDMPTPLWKAMRDAVVDQSRGTSLSAQMRRSAPHRWRRFTLHIILPTALALALFATAIWGFVLPTFERTLLDRKREMIRELTQSAWSILADAHRAEVSGELSRERAQQIAAQRIEALRYGREAKDYFWVQDMTPRMIMHPYRAELNSKDLSDFTDARGARIFVEFAEVVRRRGEGYIEYVWQWKDDPTRLAPKESYVKGFAPWGWVIGTGIYTDDVNHEIARLERGLVYGLLAIVGAVALLLLYVMRESMHIERERSDSEEQLRESHERYESLVEASTEGTLLVVQGHCRYANPILLTRLRRTSMELELLDLDDVLPHSDENVDAHRSIARLLAGEDVSGEVAVSLRRSDGTPVRCIANFSPIRIGEKSGFVLLAKEPVSLPPMRPRLERPDVLRLDDTHKLTASIELADDAVKVIDLCRTVPAIAAAWLASGVHPHHITRLVADVCDAASSRFITLTQQELGPAPVGFAFIALGSQGRQEQTLFTDQDNMFVLADTSDAARAYFGELGKRVCGLLNDAGYAYCQGRVMAQEEKWCQPLAYWKQTFSRWIARAEPRELLEFSIFFDLRTVWGPTDLEMSLRQAVVESLVDSPGFYPHFAQNALLFKPPMRLFGHILSTGEQPGQLDLKLAMMPIVSFARLYALKYNLQSTNTLARLAAMTERDLLTESTRQDLSYAYEFLMRLRLEHQVRCLEAGSPPDNRIPLGQLSHTEQVLLREAFAQVDAVQKKISYDFLGGTL